MVEYIVHMDGHWERRREGEMRGRGEREEEGEERERRREGVEEGW